MLLEDWASNDSAPFASGRFLKVDDFVRLRSKQLSRKVDSNPSIRSEKLDHANRRAKMQRTCSLPLR